MSVKTLWRKQPPPKRKGNIAHSLRARAAGVPPAFRSFARTDQKKKKWKYVFRLLGTNSLKEGAECRG
jgi:hypothetical protein